jgi:predicted DNA-binding transcriptional regulator AlpA
MRLGSLTGEMNEAGRHMARKPKIEVDELPDRMLDVGSVLELTGLSRSELYNAMGDDRQFPRPIRVHRTKTSWFYSEVMAWLKSRPRAAPYKARPPRNDGGGITALRRAQWEREQGAGHAHVTE